MAQPKLRVRHSVRELQKMYDKGNTKPLEALWRAWKGIKELPPEDTRSFFNLAGYHGEPFTGGGAYNVKYWGGYCNHGNVLFPTWHRVYVLKIEEALQTIEPDVMLPYWDETSADSLKEGIPWVLTKETVTLDGKEIPNPLISYAFPVQVDDLETDPIGAFAYTKPAGYTTVRYPLSGLVGTEEAMIKTLIHNDKYPDSEENIKLLNKNINAWLNAGKPTPPAALTKQKQLPKRGSIHRKYLDCLHAPTYTLFSNTTSAGEWNQKNPGEQVTPLESPHNDIHLSVGGYYLPHDPSNEFGIIPGANGDMGENNTASFDPIFFFHHCNVDRMFWLWQKQNGKTEGFEIDTKDPGAASGQGQGPTPTFDWDSILSMDTPLTPFMISPRENQRMYVSRDVVNIESQLGFTYSKGSLEADIVAPVTALVMKSNQKQKVLQVTGINREVFAGSFLIVAYATIAGKKHFVGSESILSRWSVKQCANCLNHLEVKAFFPLDEFTDDQIKKADFSIEIKSRDGGFKHLLDYELKVIEA